MPRSTSSRRQSESGVTIIELLIAIAVLTIGLAGLAQLFVVSTMNNAYSVNTSGGVNDAQRLIEAWKAEAWAHGVKNSTSITSAGYDSSTQTNAAFAQLSGYVGTKSQYQESVWVFDNVGLVGTISPSTPPNLPSGTALTAPAANCRLVYIRMVPKNPDPRFNQVITLSSLIYTSK